MGNIRVTKSHLPGSVIIKAEHDFFDDVGDYAIRFNLNGLAFHKPPISYNGKTYKISKNKIGGIRLQIAAPIQEGIYKIKRQANKDKLLCYFSEKK